MTSAAIAAEAISTDKEKWGELNADFWKSPFAVSAATIIVAQFMLFASTTYGDSQISGDIFAALTLIAAAMLVAGIAPSFNNIRCDHEGLEQHAGLMHFHVSWPQVKSVTPVPGGVRISFIEDSQDGPVVRRGVVQNRYDIDGNAFRRMIEKQWLEQAVLAA